MINCYVNGASIGQDAAFAVHLNDGKNKFDRVVPLQKTNANTAELRAVHYALLAVRDKTNGVALHSANRYVVSMLERDDAGGWKKNAKANSDLIDQIRILLDSFSGSSIVYEREHVAMKYVQKEARKLKSLN